MTSEVRKLCTENVRKLCHLMFLINTNKIHPNSVNPDKLSILPDNKEAVREYIIRHLVDTGCLSGNSIDFEMPCEDSQEYKNFCDRESSYFDNILAHLKPAECAMVNIVSDLLCSAFSASLDQKELATERE